MKKVLILVLTSSNWPFNVMEECIRNTWGKYKHPNVEIYYNHSSPDLIDTQLDGDVIRAPHIESYHAIGDKTISAFEYCINNNDFDYIFRPNTTSFVNIPRLLNFLDSAPTTNYYSGSPIWFNGSGVTKEDRENGPAECCSGCGYILSRDLVQLVVDKQNMWQHRLIDDIALCKFLNDNGVIAVESPRLSAHYVKDGEVYSFNKILTKEEILNQFHITARAPEAGLQIEKQKDHNSEIIQTLYNKVYDA